MKTSNIKDPAKLTRSLGYLSILFVAATFCMPTLAQDHSVGVGKSCPTATKVGDIATCGLAVTNRDGFGDDLFVDEIWDTVRADPEFRVPAEGNLPIIFVSEGVTCESAPVDEETAPIGLVLPCDIPGAAQPDGSGLGIVVRSRYTVPDAADPLLDQGTVVVRDGCNVQPIGCNPNQQVQQFGAAVSLFEPSLLATKTGPAQAKVGDEITYTIGFTDTSTGTGFPGFDNCTGSDTLLGDLGAFTAGETRDFTYTILADDPDPLPNTATITCGVVDFDNIVENSASHSVDLVAPSLTLTKACTPERVAVGDTINWAITVENTGDVELNCLVNDPTAGFTNEPLTVAVGNSSTLNASYLVSGSDIPGISNTATVSCPINGLDNVITDEATASCAVADVGIPTMSDGVRWLLVLMILGIGLLLLKRDSLRIRQ